MKIKGVFFAAILTAVLCISGNLRAYTGDGDGSAGNPYQIANVADFQQLSATPAHWNKSFILTADINLDGLTFIQSPIAPDTDDTQWNAFQGTTFTGVFEGNGHTISRLSITASTKDYIGLFGYVGYGGQIRNLRVEDVTVTGGSAVGGLVGVNYFGTLISCSVAGLVSGDSSVGGLVGDDFYGTLTSCYATGSVSGTSNVGGLAGWNFWSTLTSCYATDTVSGSDAVGGLVGTQGSGTVSFSYAVGSVTGIDSIGGLVGKNYEDYEVEISTITDCFWDTETCLPAIVGVGSGVTPGVTGKTTAEMKTLSTFTDAGWDFSDTDGDIADWLMPVNSYPQLTWESGVMRYSGGDGSAENPYQIANIADFQRFSATPTDWSKSFILTADIDLIGLTFANSPIAPDTSADWAFQGTLFTGVFEGDGHTISNLTITARTKSYIGLFGVVSGGQIHNLGVMNVAIEGDAVVGGVVGMNQGTLTACYVTGSVTGTIDYVGGLVGQNNGLLTSCYATGSVTGGDTVGGLVGYNWDGTIIFCYATGSVSGNSYVGGLVGKNYCGASSITACYTSGSVSGTGNGVGGLAGGNVEGSINSCFWDIQASGMTDGVGNVVPDPTGVVGKTTPEMQTQSTFTDVGWDFDRPVWMILGQDYPKLIWNDPDINNSGMVDFADFSILAGQWMEAECGFCDDADLTGDRGLNLHDLLVFAAQWLEEDEIGNHVFEIGIDTEWDYGSSNDSSDDEYGFGIEFATDDTVDHIEFTTPAGNTFEIPNAPVTEYPIAEGYLEIGREFDNETGHYLWGYAPGFVSPDSLSAYGDGLYTFTVYYADGHSQQTTVWFGIPGTEGIIPQPTQEPVFTSFNHGDTVSSPVTFAWQECNDPAVEYIFLETDDNIPGSPMEFLLPTSATGLEEPLDLTPGLWDDFELSFEVSYQSQNPDGIPVYVGKHSESDYEITVSGGLHNIADHVFEIEMTTEWDYGYPDSGDDEYVIGVEVQTDDTVERVEFTTPAGNTFEIPNAPVTEYPIAEGYMEIGREFDNETGRYLWIYALGFVSPDSLSAYGDGLYTFTIYYTGGYSHQTMVWFGIPGTTDPIPQPTQRPVFTSFDNGDTLTSPVTFTWEPCTDAAADYLYLGGDHESGEEVEFILPVSAAGLDEPLDLTPGIWDDFELSFEKSYDCQNADGIPVFLYKYSESDCMITVESALTPVLSKGRI